MKKTFKRLGAMFLAMVMAVSVLCTGALAANNSITITTTSSGHTYEAYQVFAGSTGTKGSNNKTPLGITGWGTGVDASGLVNALTTESSTAGSKLNGKFTNILKKGNKSDGATVEATSADAAQNVAASIKDFGDKSEQATAFAKIVAAHLSSTKTDFTEQKTTSADNKETTTGYKAENLAAGYYLVKDKSGSTGIDAYTDYILEVVGEVNVTPKTHVPTVTKKVNGKKSATANIGDVVKFELTGTLPDNYDDYESYTYVFHDTLSEGLTYNKDIQVYVRISNENGNITIVSLGEDDYQAEQTTLENGKTAITVTVHNLKEHTMSASDEITVNYSATLNENAQVGSIGNENKVYLEYSNDPNAAGEGTTGKTPEDVVKVYTFQLNVDKVDANEHTGEGSDITYTKHLSGAEFKLYKEDGTDNTKKWAKVVDGKLTGWANTEDEGTTLTTNNEGKITVAGLNADTYYLKETKAPNGYNLPTNNVTKVKIAATDPLDGTLDQNSCIGATVIKTADNKPTGEATATITNTAASALPSTGGMGTKLFYVIGGLLMAGAVIVLVIKKRRSSAE